METALHSFFVSLPLAVALWVIVLLALAAAIASRRRPGRRPGPVAVEEPAAVARTAAADSAAVTAGRRRALWLAAQDELDAAWAAFDAADQAARRAHAATAYPLLSRRRKLGDNADRERYLHHTATVACRHREISIAQLNDVYAHRGWNPRLHPVVQEAALRNAIRKHRFAAYQRALQRERAAWAAAERAADSLRAVRAGVAPTVTHAEAPHVVSGGVRWSEQWSSGELPAVA